MTHQKVERDRAVRPRICILATGVAAAIALPAPAAADSRVQAIGGDGGVAFSARCEEGEILTGLLYRAGAEFDAVAPICARAQRPAVIISASLRNYPRMFGGNGGTLDKMECGGGAPAIRSMYVNAFRKDQRVRSVSIYCGEVSADAWAQPPYPHAGYEGNTDDQADPLYRGLLVGKSECPANEVAVGIHGRSGARVDRLGLICGTPVTELYGADTAEPARPAYAPGNVRVGSGSPRGTGGATIPTSTGPGGQTGPASVRPRPRPQPPR